MLVVAYDVTEIDRQFLEKSNFGIKYHTVDFGVHRITRLRFTGISVLLTFSLHNSSLEQSNALLDNVQFDQSLAFFFRIGDERHFLVMNAMHISDAADPILK